MLYYYYTKKTVNKKVLIENFGIDKNNILN